MTKRKEVIEREEERGEGIEEVEDKLQNEEMEKKEKNRTEKKRGKD